MIDILFYIAAFIVGIIGTTIGFGSSTLLLPIALFFFDFGTALILVAIFHFSGNIGRITFFRKGLDIKLLVLFGIPSILFTLLGAWAVLSFTTDIFKLILGVFLGVFSIISYMNPKLSLKYVNRNIFLGGGLSGFFAGLMGTGGALRAAFLNAFKVKKGVYLATSASIALLVDLTRIPVYIAGGFLNFEVLIAVPILFVLAIIGAYIGKRIVGYIPQEPFRKGVLIAILIISLKFIYDGIMALV